MGLKFERKILNAQEITQTSTSDWFDISDVKDLFLQADWSASGAAAAVFASATDIANATNQFTKVGHGLATGVVGQFTTSSALPTGLSVTTDYYVIVVDADTVQFASSLANALAGTAVAISDDGTGNQTFTPTAQDGSVQLQLSANQDAQVNKGTAISIGTTASVGTYEGSNIAAQYARVVTTITAGQPTISVTLQGK